MTLVYLASQVRQGTRAIEATNHNIILQTILSHETDVVGNERMAEIDERGANDPDALSDIEWRRFRTLALIRFGTWEAAFLNHQKGMIDNESWKAFDGGARLQTSGPGYVRFWQEAASAHAPSFAHYVDENVFRS